MYTGVLNLIFKLSFDDIKYNYFYLQQTLNYIMKYLNQLGRRVRRAANAALVPLVTLIRCYSSTLKF